MSYTVKAGDTLGAIAKKLGTSVSNLTGYKSGDANKIFPGETISVKGSQTKAPANTEAPSDTPNTEVESEITVRGLVDETKDDAKKAREDRDNLIKDFTKNRKEEYEREFKRRDLDDLKEDIEGIGEQVTERRQMRDKAVDKVSSNPFASAGTISGRVGRIQDLENAQISNLLGDAQSKYGQYARELGEIGTLTGYSNTQDQLALGALNSDLSTSLGGNSTYTQALLGLLGGGSTLQDDITMADIDFQNKLALIREQAKYGNSSNPSLQLITDIVGSPTGVFNKQTGTVTSLGGEVPQGSVVQNASSLNLAQQAQQNNGGGNWLSNWWNGR